MVDGGLTAHAQPQPGSASRLHRSDRARQHHRRRQRAQPHPARRHPSGPGAGAPLRRAADRADRQAHVSDPGRREADRARAPSARRGRPHRLGDAAVRRRLARARPHRHQRDRADVRAAADPAAAQDRASAARAQSQGRPDGGHAADAQGQHARSRHLCAADRRPGVRDHAVVRRRAGGDPARQSRSGAKADDAGVPGRPAVDPRQRILGAAPDHHRMAGAEWRAAAEAGDGVRQRRGDQEPGRRRSRRLDRAEPRTRPGPRRRRPHAGRAAQPAQQPAGRSGAASRQAHHRRRQGRRRGLDGTAASRKSRPKASKPK